MALYLCVLILHVSTHPFVIMLIAKDLHLSNLIIIKKNREINR